MKRLIPAIIILIFTITVCFYSHHTISRACDQTIKDINAFSTNTLSANALEKNWQKRKEKMSIFVNHGFLDDISLYIGQLTQNHNPKSEIYNNVLKNIKTTLYMIITEQKLSAHSFY